MLANQNILFNQFTIIIRLKLFNTSVILTKKKFVYLLAIITSIPPPPPLHRARLRIERSRMTRLTLSQLTIPFDGAAAAHISFVLDKRRDKTDKRYGLGDRSRGTAVPKARYSPLRTALPTPEDSVRTTSSLERPGRD